MRSEKKKSKLYKRDMRLVGWSNPRKLKFYEEYQDLEVEHGTNLHYFHQYNYIPLRNESGATDI